jgi:cold-inducible RNA-binding protein
LNIYVGNLSYDTTDRDLEEAFAKHGTVSSARVVIDRDTGRARGFGFVEMPNQTEGQAAIAALNGTQLQGRTLNVNEARPRDDRRSGGGYAGSRGGGGGGGGRW